MKKISVVIPIYNMEKYLSRALDSILCQSLGLDDIEIIMVNDGSSDNSLAIMECYARKNNNFKIINLEKPSGSAGTPRNVGVKEATAEYIMFLDPDDYYTPNACEILYNLVSKDNIDIGIGNSITHEENEQHTQVHIDRMLEDTKVINSIDDFKQVYFCSLVVWNAIYKRSFIINNNIVSPEKIVMQDSVFAIKALFSASSIAITKQVVTHHLPRKSGDKSITHRLNCHYFASVGIAQKMIYDIFLKNNRGDDYKAYLVPIYEKLFHNKLLNATQLNDEELIYCMQSLHWFYQISLEGRMVSNVNLLSKNIADGNYSLAVSVLKLSRLRNHQL